MFKKITAIQYNWLMSMIDYITTSIPKYAPKYGLSGVTIGVLPAYPKDLTKLIKPSIIVQRVNATVSDVGMGNVLGAYTDDDGSIYDVYGKKHEIRTQLDVIGDSRYTGTLIASILSEQSFNNVVNYDYDDRYIPLCDYVSNPGTPDKVGTISIFGDIDMVDLSPVTINEEVNGGDDNYRSVVRFQCRIIQPFVDDDPSMVDLSKPLKWQRKIIL